MEFPQNLVSGGEEPWNKWYADSTQRSWVMLEFQQAITFNGLGLKSANDCPQRDPEQATVFIFNSRTAGWEQIADLELDFQLTRCKTLQFPEVRATNLRSMIIDFRTNKTTEIQLGEIVFY